MQLYFRFNRYSPLVDEAAAQVDAAVSVGKDNWLIIWAGSNDIKLAGLTATQVQTLYRSYIAARIAAGWPANRIVVPPMLPRETGLESARTQLNSFIVADAATYGYLVPRIDLNANIGAAGQQTNTTYFSDTIHLTDVGQDIAAIILQGVMFP